jgi:hypothetical protein
MGLKGKQDKGQAFLPSLRCMNVLRNFDWMSDVEKKPAPKIPHELVARGMIKHQRQQKTGTNTVLFLLCVIVAHRSFRSAALRDS